MLIFAYISNVHIVENILQKYENDTARNFGDMSVFVKILTYRLPNVYFSKPYL